MLTIITVILAVAVLRASHPVTMPLTLSILLIAAIWPVKVWLDRWIGRASYVGASIVLLFLLGLFFAALYFSASDGERCTLDAGVINCELNAIFPFNRIVKSTEKRHTIVTIDRQTGEYHYLLETWGYEGNGATGKPTSHAKSVSTGTCRPIGGRIF